MTSDITEFFKPSGIITFFLIVFTLTACQDKSKEKDKENKSTADKEQTDKDTAKRLFPDPDKTRNYRGGRAGKAEEKDSNVIEIGYVNWTEGIAMTHLVEQVLEDKMGYTVHKRLGYVGQVLDSLAMGTNDIFLDHWLSADSTLDEMADFVDLGINYESARIGLVVTKYMNVNSIEDLKNYEGTNKKIIGIDAGSQVMKKTKIAIESYDLDYDLLASSGPAMARQLKSAIDNKKPIIVTGWSPHWKFSRFDLKFLEDPEQVFGTTKNIHTLARKGLEEDYPEVVVFLRNFHMNEEQLGNLIEVFAASDNWEKAAEKWVEDHPGLIRSWLPNGKQS